MRVFLDDTQDAQYAKSPLWGDASVEDEVSLPLARVEALPARGPDPLRALFLRRFPAFQDAYEQRYASKYGRFRLRPQPLRQL